VQQLQCILGTWLPSSTTIEVFGRILLTGGEARGERRGAMSDTLEGRIAVVTGASRGIGRGTAIALGEAGATVYVTGRTAGQGERTIDATAAAVEAAGGHAIPVRVDHADDDAIAALFERVKQEAGRIDLLVNNVFAVPNPPAWGGGFWDHPIQIWDDQVGIGLRAHYVACWHAAQLLFASEAASGATPLIVDVSSPGGQSYHFSASYGAGKAGLDRLTADMAIELEPKGVAAIALYPGAVSTEFNIEASGGTTPPGIQTPLFVGRSIAALARLARSGPFRPDCPQHSSAGMLPILGRCA
jgi:dehydrogenase/reductase SDR family protein 1